MKICIFGNQYHIAMAFCPLVKSANMNRISFHDTHVYPGCSAIIFFRIVPDGSTVQAIAEFSDGSIAAAEVGQVNPDEIFVRIDAYKTARDTRISEKAWRLTYDDARDLWKVAARM